jgi:hypothetical protein
LFQLLAAVAICVFHVTGSEPTNALSLLWIARNSSSCETGVAGGCVAGGCVEGNGVAKIFKHDMIRACIPILIIVSSFDQE